MLLDHLNLMQYQELLQFKTEEGKRFIFDPIRKKYLVFQTEEFVRQLIVQYLLLEKHYPAGKIALEVGLKINDMQKRCDILVYDNTFMPFMIVECKAPKVPISEAVFLQIATYNIALKVPYLVVSNGIRTYCSRIDHEKESFEFLNDIPMF
jgi:hypothetical protein